MELNIDLNHRPAEGKTNVNLQWVVEVQEPKSGFLSKLFKGQTRVSGRRKITVSDVKKDPTILFDCNRSLFSIVYNSKVYEQAEFPVTVELDGMEVPFQVLFDQNAVLDCKKPQDGNPRQCKIAFTVQLLDMDGSLIHEVPEEILINLVPLSVKPVIEIDLDDVADGVQYDSATTRLKVGQLVGYLNEAFMFTPKYKAEVTLSLADDSGQSLDHLISFEDGKRTTEIDLRAAEKPSTPDGKPSPRAVTKDIYVDFTSIPNPAQAQQQFTVRATAQVWPKYAENLKETRLLPPEQFDLLQDQQGTELRIYLSTTGADGTASEPRDVTTSQRDNAVEYDFTPRSGLMGQATIRLANLATDTSRRRAGLWVRNLTLVETNHDSARPIDKDGHAVSTLLRLNDSAELDKMQSPTGHFIPNGNEAGVDIQMIFDPGSVAEIESSPNFDLNIEGLLTFDYCEDRNGDGPARVDWKKGSVAVDWQAHMEPNPEWLCVDYGSSAIVCSYNGNIIDLKKQKNNIFRKAKEGAFKRDTSEKDTMFLSSDLLFHRVVEPKATTLCSQLTPTQEVDYLDLSVCLSPTSSLVTNEYRMQLPCLKILVGNELLPPKVDYKTFKYARIGADGKLESVDAGTAADRGEPTALMRVSSVFKESYAALFRRFISPTSGDNPINKLVLTYPNTYTPLQLKTLRTVVEETFPKLRPGFLRFVSESDAVAAYYLANWDSLNQGVPRRPDFNVNTTETVLIYDMGAGTLDLTLLRKYVDKSTGRLTVDILGKIGSGKAGNYIDFLIAEIIADKDKGRLLVKNTDTVSTKSQANETVLKERIDLKDKIKNNVKPAIASPDSPEYSQKSVCDEVALTSQDIVDDPRFQAFLADVTDRLLKRLGANVGETDARNAVAQIDTVLMSGRSCRLAPLQKALKNAVTDRRQRGTARVLAFNPDKAKTVVAEGALDLVQKFDSDHSPVVLRSRRLYASYGLIFKALGGSYQYVELMNASEFPLEADTPYKRSIQGRNVTLSNVNAADRLTLVQTYLSADQTAEAFANGDTEFVSKMEEYPMAAFQGRGQLNARMEINHLNHISLFIGGNLTRGSAPQGVDLNNEITRRSLWPVII